jgi:hypothetical protein
VDKAHLRLVSIALRGETGAMFAEDSPVFEHPFRGIEQSAMPVVEPFRRPHQSRCERRPNAEPEAVKNAGKRGAPKMAPGEEHAVAAHVVVITVRLRVRLSADAMPASRLALVKELPASTYRASEEIGLFVVRKEEGLEERGAYVVDGGAANDDRSPGQGEHLA